eukprot:6207177-Pleurochrysis_carterae.AAC.2
MAAAGRFLEETLEASSSSDEANETVAHVAHVIAAIVCDRETAVYGTGGETHNVHRQLDAFYELDDFKFETSVYCASRRSFTSIPRYQRVHTARGCACAYLRAANT